MAENNHPITLLYLHKINFEILADQEVKSEDFKQIGPGTDTYTAAVFEETHRVLT